MENQIAALRMGQRFKRTTAGEIPVDWEAKKLGDLADIRYGLGQLSRNPFLKEGDIIVVTSGENSGDVARITKEWAGAIAGHDLVLSPSSEINPSYCLEYLISEKAQAYFSRQSERFAQPHINVQQLSAMPISIPSLAEQEKIAEVLSAVDETIQKAESAIAKAKHLKKGLMRQLLQGSSSRGGPFGTIGACARINAETLTTRTPAETLLRYIDISSIERPGVLGLTKQVAFGSAPSRARRVVRAGDIIVSTVRPYLRAFAMISSAEPNLIASTAFAVLSPQPNVDREFLFQFILSDLFVNYLVERMTESKYPAVNPSDIAACPIPLPSLARQRKISEILAHIDRAIIWEEDCLHGTEKVKTGLMRVLLSGKLRVRAQAGAPRR